MQLVDILEQTFRAFQLDLSCFGERKPSAGPIQKPDPETIFQRGDMPQNAGGRGARSSTGARQANDLDNSQKEPHRLNLVHYLFKYRKGITRFLALIVILRN